jgi:hypothetical protein
MTHPLRTWICLIGTIPLLLSACDVEQREGAQPKLVVLIAVDGLRADLLDRYDAAFQGGFRRLRDTGLRFEEALVDHAITVSHAGHVTLATGLFPSNHGIVDAAFYVPEGNGRVLIDAVEDTTEALLGIPELGGVSPRRVLGDGLAEWIIHADPDARSLAVGSGNVSSLLYVFHAPADVYWYRDGKYVTSTFYRSAYPAWVERFNSDLLPGYVEASRLWENQVPVPFHQLARADQTDFEGDKVHTSFPHTFEEELADDISRDPQTALAKWFRWTPSLDEATLKLARSGIEAMALGQREATDYLTIVLSMVDSNSHYYGPLSMETFDTLMRLDQALGEFFRYLDQTLGKDTYVVAVSSDHGFPEVPEYRGEIGLPGSRIPEEQIEALLAEVRAELEGSRTMSEATARRVVEIAESRDFVAEAFTSADLSREDESDSAFWRLYKNSFREERIPRLPLFSLSTFHSAIGEAGVMLRLEEGAMIDLDVAVHGSPYRYDRHVPMIFMGSAVEAGVSYRPVRTADLAPTLAQLARIPIPGDLDGQALIAD